MANAILKSSPNTNGTGRDKLVMVVNGPDTVIPFIRFRDCFDAQDTYNQIFTAHTQGHTGDLEVEINGKIHKFTYDLWQAVGGALDKWYEEYLSLADQLDQTESQF